MQQTRITLLLVKELTQWQPDIKDMENIKIQHTIKLLKVKFPEFKVNSSDFLTDKQTEEVQMNLEYATAFPAINDNTFIIKFTLNLNSKTNDFNAIFKMVALFQVNGDVDEEFKKSDFVQLNAPAIAFPYLRSFITTVTTNAGFMPVILPSINISKNANK